MPTTPADQSQRTPLWRRLVRVALVTAVALVALALAGLSAVYAALEVPRARDTATRESTVVTWVDGREMVRLGEVDRQVVPLDQVSEAVQQAVLAAEDRRFYEHSGVSVRGVLRALTANVEAGRVVQGASTITMQYAQNAYLDDGRSWRGKLQETLLALKLGRERSKDEILEDYLNTVYFGRGAYGVEVAAEAFFGVPAAELDHAQGAVLAAQLRGPALYDPARAPERARARWDYVLDGLVEQGVLTPTARQATAYPQVLPPTDDRPRQGPQGYVLDLVEDELTRLGFEDALDRGGLVVRTTLRPRAQQAAVDAVEAVVPQPEQESQSAVQGALVAVRPTTGEVFAYYGGRTGQRGFDYARQGPQDAGSTMKAWVLAAALEQGIPLSAPLDGSSPREFPGYPRPVQNYGGVDAGQVDVLEATVRSINTAYLELTRRVGPERVAELARRAGYREADPLAEPDGTTGLGIGLGVYGVRVLDQAAAVAAFAAGGAAPQPFVVRQISDTLGRTLYEPRVQRTQVVGPDVAADVAHALSQVVQRGTAARNGQVPGRQAFGKTGTTQDNRDAWMVGGTRNLVAAVWLGRGDDEPLPPSLGTGGSGPARIWSAFLDAALRGVPAAPLPEPALVGSPTPTPTTAPPVPTALAAPATAPGSAAPGSAAPASPAPAAPAPPPAVTQPPAPVTAAAAPTTAAPATAAPATAAPATVAPATPAPSRTTAPSSAPDDSDGDGPPLPGTELPGLPSDESAGPADPGASPSAPASPAPSEPEPAPASPAPSDPEPADPEPADPEPAPASPAPSDPEPADPEPAPASPAPSDPEPAPADPEPAPADPEPAPADPEPAPSEPGPAEPTTAPAEPEPTPTPAAPQPAEPSPSPSDPEPTEPSPSDPEPTEPAPAEPRPAEPSPSPSASAPPRPREAG